MHRFKRLLTAMVLTVLSVILLFSAGFAYLIMTPLGGKILVRYFKKQFVSVGLMHVGHYEGTLQNGFILEDVRIKGLSYLPDAYLRIQKVHVRLPLWDISHADLGIFNARIFIPDCEPVVFTGQVYAGQIKGDLYSRSIDLHSAGRFWVPEDIIKNLQGFISNVDVKILGSLSSPMVNGTFLVDELRIKSIQLKNVPSRAHLILMPVSDQLQIEGKIFMDSGIVNVRKVDLQLSPSQFIFKSDAFNPALDLHLGSQVEDMEIHLTIKGSFTHPQLTVTSDPPMPTQEALNVLFSGNALSASTSPFSGGNPSDLGEKFLNDSYQNANDDQFGMKTKLTDNLKLGVEVDQMPTPPGVTNNYYTRKINGEMDLNDHMSLNISQAVLPQDNYAPSSYQDVQNAPETQVYLQYKKRF